MSLPLLNRRCENLAVQVFADRRQMGRHAGETAAAYLRKCLSAKDNVRIIFAAAPSQNEFLAALAAAGDIDWSRVTAFHMDEYIGLPAGSAQRFSHYLNRHLFDVVRPGQVHLIPEGDERRVCRDYAALISRAPLDMVCLGVGENGHLAFNDPPVADFHDPEIMKVVELDPACRRQQVNDGCFAAIDQVPTQAVTLTIPTLMSAARLFCMVPGITKRAAVRGLLQLPLSTACPATVLRTHPACELFTDVDAYGEITHG
ncbi:glucosamine-6-phosphate deaminase [Acerihabitans arboris]|uniref:Glucosamine-6-phosphate deaminase n=1 Tax=Acerihabitans arboris TaxID=2691583 RepID=A0A845SM43_9GAMM|nr:glucosamine-6-phosphate deaminase [Acerihabitans arboris]NDL64034.1 glucosamine-6-phosphate deaminase [Acerihabitans arboris]